MSVGTQDLYDMLAKKYSAGQQSRDFTESFWLALNQTIVDFGRIGLSITPPTSLRNTSIDVDSTKYLSALLACMHYHLNNTGLWGSDDTDKLMVERKIALNKANTQVLQDLVDGDGLYTRLGDTS